MKLIIAGSRTISVSPSFIRDCLLNFNIKLDDITEIVSGMAKGMDTSGGNFATKYKLPVESFWAEWDKHGKVAGHIRNKKMAEYADMALVIHNGSKGSANMIMNMEKLHKPVLEVVFYGGKDETI